MQCTRRVHAAWCAGAVLALALIAPAAPAAAETGRERARDALLIPSAGWHGRPIRQPIQDAAPASAPDRPPRGWEAGPASLGTGTHRATGSQRVREVQWRLKALGYRPGPIDGIFGVRTRAAVAWFQVKHGFRIDGRASFAVVRHLRARTTPRGNAVRAVGRLPTERAIAEPVVVAPAGAGTPLWAVIGLILLAFCVGFAAVALRHWLREPRRTRAIGYVHVSGGQQRLGAHASAIQGRCAEHGIVLTGLVTEEAAEDRALRDRPGLAMAFRQVEEGKADCLVIGRTGRLSRSPGELTALLDWMGETPLVVLNADPGPPPTGRWARRPHVRSTRDA